MTNGAPTRRTGRVRRRGTPQPPGSIRLLKTDDGALWDRLAGAIPGHTSFHAWSWLQMQSRLFGWRFDPLLVLAEGVPVGVVPVLLTNSRLPRPVYPPFPYVGPLVPMQLLHATLIALRRWQRWNAVESLHLEFGPGASGEAEDALRNAGCFVERESTFVVPLARDRSVEMNSILSPSRRRAVRLADSRGIHVRSSRPGEVTALVPRLLEAGYGSRGGTSPYPDEVGEVVERWIAGRAGTYSSTVLVRGDAAGAQVALSSGTTVHAWAGGAFREHRREEPYTVMMWDLLQWAAVEGFDEVDLVGRVDDGIASFKRSLGGIERPYLVAWSKAVPVGLRAPARRVIEAIRLVAREVRRRLPVRPRSMRSSTAADEEAAGALSPQV